MPSINTVDWYRYTSQVGDLWVGASQGNCLCTASVKFASGLHHDKGTCCLKVRVTARAFTDLKSANMQESLIQKMNICEVKLLILDMMMCVLIFEHCIVFECSVHSLYLLLSDHQHSRLDMVLQVLQRFHNVLQMSWCGLPLISWKSIWSL